MPSKAQLTEQARRLGVDVAADWTKARITEAIQTAEAAGVAHAAAPLAFTGKRLIEFTCHRVGPPRRSPGQRVWLSGAAAAREALSSEDAKIVTDRSYRP